MKPYYEHSGVTIYHGEALETMRGLPFLHHILDVSTRPGAVVLDPFLGSGRSIETSKDMGLTAIGIEIEELWCRRASERLAQYNLFQAA